MDLSKAIEYALRNNLDLHAESYSQRIAEKGIQKAEGPFDTYVLSSVSHSFVRQGISSALQGGDIYMETSNSLADFGFRKLVKTGSIFELKLDFSRFKGSSSFLVLNPSYITHLNLSVAQPLLKNGGISFQTAPIHIATNLHLISEDRWEAFVDTKGRV